MVDPGAITSMGTGSSVSRKQSVGASSDMGDSRFRRLRET